MAERQAEDNHEDDSAQQPSGWNTLCSEKHLAEIALLVTDWREISPFLGLTAAEEHEILGSAPHSVLPQKIAMLRKWKEKRGAKATYKRLRRVFKKCGKLDLELKVQKMLTKSSNSSSSSDTEEGKYACLV